MRALLGLDTWPDTRAVIAACAAEAEQLGRLFKRETEDYSELAGISDVFREWSRHHFGRDLPPAARGVLLHEIQHPMAEVPKRAPVVVPAPTLKEYLHSDRGRAAVDEIAAAKAIPELSEREREALAAGEIVDVFESGE